MPDKFTETKTVGLGNRMVDSVKNVFVGLLMFVASFGLLYWNEGRADLSLIAKQAVEISSETANTNAELEGKLISTTGDVKTEETVGDELFLYPGDYLAVERNVEMYAWIEDTEEKENTNLGGSQTTETTYTYRKDWVADPKPSSSFKYPEEHGNPELYYENGTYTVSEAAVGVYSFDASKITLPEFSDLSLKEDMIFIEVGTGVLANSQYIFLPYTSGGSLTAPKVGDVRVSYKVLEPGFSGTVFGKLDGSEILPSVDKDNNELFRLFAGTRDEAVATLHEEFVMMLWLFRVLGFLLMWMGLTALFGPFTTLLDILPILGSLGRGVVGAVMFVVAFVLSIITILVSMILHNIVALIVLLALSLVGIGFAVNILRKKLKEKQAGGGLSGGIGGMVNKVLGK